MHVTCPGGTAICIPCLISDILMTKETPALPFSSVISNGTTADPITGSTTGKMLPMHIR